MSSKEMQNTLDIPMFYESLSFLEVNVMQYVGLTAVSLSVMKTVHSWACMKDKMVATVFLSKTSNDCCSSKIRLARSSNTYNTTPNTPSHGLSASIRTDFLLKCGEISEPGFACSPAAMSCRVVRCVALYQRKPGTKKSPFEMKNKAIIIEPERDTVKWLWYRKCRSVHPLVLLCEGAVLSTPFIDRLCDTNHL